MSTEPLTARHGAFEDVVLLTGTLVAARATHITVPFTPSWQLVVSEIADTGTPVSRGDRVGVLSNADLASNLEDKEFELKGRLSELSRSGAESRLELRRLQFLVDQARAELDKARIRADVPADLVAGKELAERRIALAEAQTSLKDATADLDTRRRTSEIDLELEKIEIEAARREIEVARETLDQLSVEAPADGLFLVGDHPWENRKIQQGDRVWPGLTLGTIPDLDSLEVDARLSDVDGGRLTAGMPARIVLDASPSTVLRGRVMRVAPIAREEGHNSLRRFFDVKISLERDATAEMIPGMSARVEVVRERRDDALQIPRETVERTPAGAVVVHTESGEQREVHLGPCNALWCVVEGGLDGDETLLPVGRSESERRQEGGE